MWGGSIFRVGGGLKGVSMKPLIEEAIERYWAIIRKRKKPKRVKKKKEILWDEKRRKNGEVEGAQAEEGR